MQAPVCDVVEVATAEQRARVSGRRVPEAAWESFVLSCWWLLREAEALALDLAAARIFGDGKLVEVRLGTTKMD